MKAMVAMAFGLLVVLLAGIASHRAVATLEHMLVHGSTHDARVIVEELGARFRALESAYLRQALSVDERSARELIEATDALRRALAALDESGFDPIALSSARRLRALVQERLDDPTFLDPAGGTEAMVLFGQLRESLRQASRRVTLEESEQARLGAFLGAAATMLSLLMIAWGLMALHRNRADREAAHRQVRESESRLRAILEGMAEGVVTMEADGTIVEANAAAAQLFGYGAGEMIGMNVAGLAPEHHRAVLRATLERMLAGPGEVREQGREMRAVHKDGRKLYVNASFSAIRIGERRQLTVLVTDVTERRSMVKALHASETQLREIADAMPALIAYVDAERRVRFHNKAYEEYFGLPPERIRGAALWEVVGSEVYALLEEHMDQVLRGKPVRYERRHPLPGGEVRDLAGHFFPRLEDGRVTGFYSLVTDITDLKRVDRMKSEFISTVSHELRTPLTSIRGSLGLLSGGVTGKLPQPMAQLVDIAKNNCERLIRLINDILDLEKIESGRMRFAMREESLAALAGQALAGLEGFAAQHQVALRLEARAAPRVRADADRLVQVVTNLVSNAVKFSPAGAAVTVRVLEEGGRARLEVQDRGPGIQDEFRRRIFEKFSQADGSDRRMKGGSGLGLNISRAIVEQMGGTIGFATREGEGSTFHFELPAVAAYPLPAVAAAPAAARVLVCEDDADVARLISMMLERAGLAPVVARDAREAREALAAGGFRAMTLDVHLPGEDGLSLLRALREAPATRELPVVIVSAVARDGAVRVGSEDLSLAQWLDKPIDDVRLVAAVRGAVAGPPEGCPRILHVENDPDVRGVAAAIAPECATVEFSDSLEGARAKLAARSFDLVIVDLELPGGGGEELAPLLRTLAPATPSLVFSGHEATPEIRSKFDAVLVKARTTNDELARTIRRLLRMAPAAGD